MSNSTFQQRSHKSPNKAERVILENMPNVSNFSNTSKVLLNSLDWAIEKLQEASLPHIEDLVPSPGMAPLDPPLHLNPQSYERFLEAYDFYTPVGPKSRFTGLLRSLFTPRYGSKQDFLISIVVPIYKPHMTHLERAIESVKNQSDPRFELVLVDDGSGQPILSAFLRKIAHQDGRVKVFSIENSGISGATNFAISKTQGKFIGFLDHDDELHKDALKEVYSALEMHPELDLIYSDEDKLNTFGKREDPFLKPDWSPELLLSTNYISHFSVIRKSLIDQVGGLRSEMNGSQDYDLTLRVTEKTNKIHHIPKVLYHWRRVRGSAALDANAKPWAIKASESALSDALVRRNEPLKVKTSETLGSYILEGNCSSELKASVIIPFRDDAPMLRDAISSLVDSTGLNQVEWILIDNGSTEFETKALLNRLPDNFLVLRDEGPFNWSRLNNLGATHATGEILVFLNNDIIGKSDNWLKQLASHAVRDNIGAVGARLLYPDNKVQHAGIVLGLNGFIDHIFRDLPSNDPGYSGLAKSLRNVSAVTGACLATKREHFNKLQGFDEDFSVAFNDIDYCLRLQKIGLRVAIDSACELYHLESKSRGKANDSKEADLFRSKWRDVLKNPDPFFHPLLSRFNPWYGLE